MKKFTNMEYSDWLEFVKIKRLVIPISCFVLGLLLSSSFHFIRLLVPLYGIILYSGVAILNDIHDLDIDKLTNPFRPLPDKKISSNKSYLVSLSLIILGLIYSVFIAFYFSNLYFLIFPLIHTISGYVYSKYLSRHYATSTTLLGFTHGFLPYIMAVFMFGVFNVHIIFVGIAIFLSLSFTYIIKDFKDEEGDKLKRETLITSFGSKRAKKITFFLFLALSGISLISFWLLDGTINFLVFSLLSWSGLMYIVYMLFRTNSETQYERLLNFYRYLIVFYILSFVFL